MTIDESDDTVTIEDGPWKEDDEEDDDFDCL
eukprot:CAMPEP_0114363978 /NCGR_PEP_ID=MMETSP0101-20121206/27097_1 /TAXON_ID=38822 ORGANISM="Pteridomonas danica, Strain PT" /NCGR_SAMPLE_ID=MMETSP0101 /ASSEMBLY_ACC=CAM_ASM_000211 /LENGTH=30 /DNA_ID= /DNA_START= /DNA_END= /DNA_ORIENTATION=